MSSFDLTSPVVRELRAARPRAPEALRERVLAAREPEPRFAWPSRYTIRRVALVAVPACVVAGVGAALIHGIVNSAAPQRQAVQVERQVTLTTKSALQQHTASGAGRATTAGRPTTVYGIAPVPHGIVQNTELIPRTLDKTTSAHALPPSRARLQDYRASLSVRVDGLDALSPSTQKAMRTARSLGGYVVSAQFNAQKQGYSDLVFRIPITRIQQAIARFSSLGTIVAQDIRISDLQAQYNQLVKRINALRIAIAKVDDQLASPSLSNEERVRLEQRRGRLVATLSALTTQKAGTVRRAQLATVSLSLTTEQAIVPVKPHRRGPVGRALHDAGSILAKEVSWALYALIVLGPLALLAALAFALTRVGRRYADRRLLESS